MNEQRKFLSTNDLFAEAANLARSSISFVFVPDGLQLPRFLGALPQRFAHKLSRIQLHWTMTSMVRARARDDLIIIPEFSTFPLMLVAWRIWAQRRKVLCFLNHNVQRAHTWRVDRWALKLLLAMGFRFGCYENVAGVAGLGITTDPAEFLLMPHAVDTASLDRPSSRQLRPRMTVGVIGRYRPEKGFDDILLHLVDAIRAGQLDAEIILGCPETEPRERWAEAGVTVLGTETLGLYQQALRACDVLICNYSRRDYFFRSSNVITDAVALGTAVVCPNFPILRWQVTHPVPVGATFDDVSNLVPAIAKALEIAASHRSNFDLYVDARQLLVIARHMDEFIDARIGRAA